MLPIPSGAASSAAGSKAAGLRAAGLRAAGPKRPFFSDRASQQAAAMGFSLPLVISLALFFYYAFARTAWLSLTDWDLFNPPEWVGLANYGRLFSDHLFRTALHNTLVFAITVTLAQTALALLLAVGLNQRIRGITAFRAAYYLPSVTSSVVITLIFVWLFQRGGAINYGLTQLLTWWPLLLTFAAIAAGLQAAQVLWERWHRRPARVLEPSLALVSILLAAVVTGALWAAGIVGPLEGVRPVQLVWLNTRMRFPRWESLFSAPVPLVAVMMLNTWTTAPTFMLIYLAALQDIPRELYEAASVDGATPWQQFRHVTVPQLRPITFLVLTLGMIGTLQMFDQVAVIGSQAPLESTITLAYYVYHNMFPPGAVPRVGMAGAAAVVLAVLTLTIVLIQRRLVEERKA